MRKNIFNIETRAHRPPQGAGKSDIANSLATAVALEAQIASLRCELAEARREQGGIQRRLGEMDEEMRLAARLQRDFLPRRLPEVGPVRFGALYRPASWVSGDLYDMLRLDETHLGFYVADVVGHGMPAALMTMFIKKALQTKRITAAAYEIVSPESALAELNTDICEQNLSGSQFCTAVYAVLDVPSLRLSYARGGHPEMILVRDGQVTRLRAEGSLLGVFEGQQFALEQVTLAHGDRVLLYSDGAEDALRLPGQPRGTPLEQLITPYLFCRRDELLLGVSTGIDDLRGDKPLEDDVTLVVMDVE